MATTKPDVKYVQIERVQFWADDRGEIHITSDDPDAKETLHTTLSNNEQSKRYHPTFYAQLARLLTEFGKSVPGWTDSATS